MEAKSSLKRMRTAIVWSALFATALLAGCSQSANGPAEKVAAEPEGPSGSMDDRTAFGETTYKVLVTYCAGCHGGPGASPPPLASPDLEIAHTTIVTRQLADTSDPGRSRIVRKVVDEKHFCWTGDCAANGAEIQKSIEDWAALMGVTSEVNVLDSMTLRSAPTTFISKRVNGNLVALYTFTDGSGTTIKDMSGVAPAMDLTLPATGVEWVPGQGIKFTAGTANAKATATTSAKLFNMIAGGATPSNEYTVEAWLLNTNNTQAGPAQIVDYAQDNNNANFALVQTTNLYGYRVRSSATAASTNGTPSLNTAAGTLTTQLTHVVATFNGTAGRRIYLNGVNTGVTDASVPATLSNWNNAYQFTLGNLPTAVNNRAWPGTLYLVAIYNRALSPEQVKQNFDAGYSEVLTFDIAEVTGIPGASIVFEAGSIDKASYLFAKPTYVGPNANGLTIKGIQIAINGKLPAVGQAYRNVDASVSAEKVELSSIGTTMAKDKGEASDSFQLVFNAVGDKSIVSSEPAPAPLDMVVETRTVIPDSGVRTYDQINTTMSTLTGVPLSNVAINGTNGVFTLMKQALPSNANVMSFLASQQVGIAKLAVEYCDAMIGGQNDTTLRNNFFGTTPAFEFGAVVATAFSTQAKKDLISNTLINKMIGTNLANQPTTMEAYTEINSLINDLIAQGVASAAIPDDAARTRAIVKGACGAVLSSAALMVK